MYKLIKKFAVIFLIFIISSYCLYQLLSTKSIKIDKIYVINLDKSQDRYKQMQAKLSKIKLPIEYTRFPAFDGNEIELVNIETDEKIKGSEFATNEKLLSGKFEIRCSPNWHGGFKPLKLNIETFHPRVKGEIGCACSHRKIWEDIQKNGYTNSLILEDDIIFKSDFEKYLARSLNNVPDDYDLIYIGILDSIDSYKDILNNKWLRKIKRIFDRDLNNPFFKQVRRSIGSTEAYIVSTKGAEILLRNTTKHSQIDRVMSNLIEEKKITAYVTKPVLTQQDGPSIIGQYTNSFETLKQEE
jgi:glycosyl transferase, family 25